MKKELYIIGAGSVGGHIAHNIIEYSDEFAIAGFFDDDPQKVGTFQFGIETIGTVNDALTLDGANLFIGIAFPKSKRKIIEILSFNPTLKFPTLIHPKAWISSGVSIGRGCIIYPGISINYGSKIKDFVCINMNCSLGHHTVVGNYSSLAPGIKTGGNTVMEEGTDMGIGASTLQGIRIGADSIVGGQAMVVEDVEAGSTVVGIPAKMINQKV